MNITFVSGIVGSVLLVAGGAWPFERVRHPAFSVKNWLFAIGTFIMLIYAILNYTAGGSVFFVFLETMLVISNALMMLDIKERISTPVLAVSGSGFVIWSLKLFDNYNVLLFIIGLTLAAVGYAMKTGSLHRTATLMFAGIFIALYSYLAASWIFFWLNVFFALFSAYYVLEIAVFKRHD